MDAEKKERNIITQLIIVKEMDNLSDKVLKLMQAISNLNNNDEFDSIKNIKLSLYKLCKHIDINFDNINIKDNEY